MIHVLQDGEYQKADTMTEWEIRDLRMEYGPRPDFHQREITRLLIWILESMERFLQASTVRRIHGILRQAAQVAIQVRTSPRRIIPLMCSS